MKRAMVYFLVICFLSGSAVEEVFKIPTMVSHYLDHLQRNPKVCFLDFLSMHYWGNDINDNDRDQDMRLPFKKFSHSQHQVLLCSSDICSLPNIKFYVPLKQHFFSPSENIDAFTNKLYRPPKGSIFILA